MEKKFWTKEFLDKHLIICSKSIETHFGFNISEIWSENIWTKSFGQKVQSELTSCQI